MMRICTFNMLYERHYAKYARVPLMPADEREQILRATLGDLCRRCDVLCLQECHYHSTTFADIAASHHFLRANGNSGETVAIAYRRDRFDADESSLVVNSFINARTGQREPKCALTVTLFDKTNGGRPMRITSTHVPWDAVSAAPVFDQLADFTAARTNATIDAVVCGDFNLEDRRGKDLLVATFPPEQGWIDASAGLSATVCSARGTFDKIDFVFARRAVSTFPDAADAPFTAEPPSKEPATAEELIKHAPLAASTRATLANPTDPLHDSPFGRFPSDHAAVIATLRF
jgi:endonuclease/exonuclease/phosphatase family metal-dependent hydrolase